MRGGLHGDDGLPVETLERRQHSGPRGQRGCWQHAKGSCGVSSALVLVRLVFLPREVEIYTEPLREEGSGRENVKEKDFGYGGKDAGPLHPPVQWHSISSKPHIAFVGWEASPSNNIVL